MVFVLCLFLIGCSSQQFDDTYVSTPTTQVVYEIYLQPMVDISLGNLQFPLSRYGLDLVLENVGEVNADVYLVIQTSDLRDPNRIFCRRSSELRIPTLHPGQDFVYTFSMDGCNFPREDNYWQGMGIIIEVHDAKTGDIIGEMDYRLEDGSENEIIS